MDAYPAGYVQHNLPFLLLFGIDDHDELQINAQERSLLQDGGFIVKSELPPVSGDRVKRLLGEFRRASGSSQAWRAKSAGPQNGLVGYRFRLAGRKYVLPPRKANPPVNSLGQSPPSSPRGSSPKASSPSSWALHSPLSPLSPESPTFPDGLMTNYWLKKHQDYIPSALLSFFYFTSDAKLNSLNDNQLKSEINQISSALRSSGYKTRHVVVLVSDKTLQEAADTEERLLNIRRATGLDSKNSLFLLASDVAETDCAGFVTTVLSSLQPSCVEYYRDLAKHARRKKARGSIPPPTAPPTKGTSQVLSAQGWNVRYEFKLGVFAEYRQEMDAAGRHYTLALDALLSSDGMFETTASWSPRWNETRLLADSIAFRLIRTLLWNSSTTQAVQTWVKYRDRIREAVDNHGKGSSNYGWEAWESRWANMMAELIQRADLPVFSLSIPVSDSQSLLERIINIFAPPEKAIPVGERLPPWQLLHHAGYWSKLAATHAGRRRDLAENLAEEDRAPPGRSPAAHVVQRYGMYDTYLCPEPHNENPLEGEHGYDHLSDIISKLHSSGQEFSDRNQQRFVDQLKLEHAKELIRSKNFGKALGILEPLWKEMRWRKEGWWTLVYYILCYLHECASSSGHQGLVLLTTWELLSAVFPSQKDEKLNLLQCLDSVQQSGMGQEKVSVSLDAGDVVSFLSTSFVFSNTEGHVADHLECQLALTSCAKANSQPITFSAIVVQLDGSVDQIELSHAPSGSERHSGSSMAIVQTEEIHTSGSHTRYKGSADLTLGPGETKVYSLDVVFRDAGDVRPQKVRLSIDTSQFRLDYDASLRQEHEMAIWWQDRPTGLRAKRLGRREENLIKILPKPPRMEINLRDQKEMYFTDERAILQIDMANLEDEETEVTLEVRFLHRDGGRVAFSWLSRPEVGVSEGEKLDSLLSPRDLPGHAVGNLAPDAEHVESISITPPSIPSDYVLEIKALYHLVSDLDTTISKTFSTDISFVSPFEANYDFLPRVHLDPWPNYFCVHPFEGEGAAEHQQTEPAFGLAQKWCLVARVASFADETMLVRDASLILNASHGGIQCAIEPHDDENKPFKIAPQEMHERRFIINVQKLSLEDKRAAALELSLQIQWQRTSDANSFDSTTSTLIVPRRIIPSSEPRVLASALISTAMPPLVHLDYTLENPTMHFLTFDLTMEASEEFAISGPKVKSCNILPMSRQKMSYNLLPLVRGTWITPKLNVVDRYFNKTLKVLGTEGVKVDKKDISVWIDAEED